MKNNKGITLIALVITIIVMLILVGVTIKVATEGRIFTYAANAVKETKKAQEEEQRIVNGIFTIGGTTYNSIDEFVGGTTSEPLVAFYGDSTLNGIVDSSDISGIFNCISYLEGETVSYITEDNIEQIILNSDLNLDGEVSEEDITILSKFLMNQIPSLPWTGEIPE